jgi:Ca-activated chloride channel homolog
MVRRRAWLAGVLLVAACTSTVQGKGSAGTASTVSRHGGGVSAPSTSGSGGTTTASASVPTVIVLDASSSMLTSDAPGRRIDAARTAVVTLARSLPSATPAGLVVFGSRVGDAAADKAAGCRDISTLVPLAAGNRGAITSAVRGVHARGYTPLAAALAAAAKALPKGPGRIAVISDGADTCTPSRPCPTAGQLHANHPGLEIDTVGFKVGSADGRVLRCIADAAGGVAVTAANAAQLVARMRVMSDPSTADRTLTSTGYRGLEIGTRADDLRTVHPDLPAVASAGRVVIVYVDCDLTFQDGKLISIAPHTGVATLDGLAPGDDVSRAVTLYGRATPQRAGAGTYAIFAADAGAGTGYKISYTPTGTLTGPIRTIVLCLCKPAASTAHPLRVVDVQLLANGGVVPMTLWATDDVSDCAAHSHGTLVEYFRQHPCRGASRYLWTFSHNGRTLVLSVASIVAAVGPLNTGNGGDIYKWAQEFIRLENASGTGSINDLLTDGHAVGGIASRIPSDEVFDVTGQDNGVTVFDAWYLTGSTDPNDQQLTDFLNGEVFLSAATTVRNEH